MLTKEEIERRIDAASKTPTEATCCMDLVKLACEAADEIERLTAAIEECGGYCYNASHHPEQHQAIQDAIDKAYEESGIQAASFHPCGDMTFAEICCGGIFLVKEERELWVKQTEHRANKLGRKESSQFPRNKIVTRVQIIIEE